MGKLQAAVGESKSAGRSAGPSVPLEEVSCWGQFHQHFKRSFYAHISQKRKKYSQGIRLFAPLGSLRVKATCKMLVKSTPLYVFKNVYND